MFHPQTHIIKLGLQTTRRQVLKYIEQSNIFSNSNITERKRIQKNALMDVLQHSYHTVPYYKELFDKYGLVEKGSINIDKFHTLPELNKDIIRTQGSKMYATDHESRGSYKNSSGGSTGEPVVFIQDNAYDNWNIATKIWFNTRLGKEPGEPEIKLWGSDRDIIQGNLTFKDRLINRFYNRQFFNCYDFRKEHIENLIDLHNTFKPSTYWAYVDAMTEFARYVNREKITVHTPKHIITSIGPLYDDARIDIENAFGCKVYNQYGSREVGVGAIDNPDSKWMDIFFWRLLIEIVPKDSKSNEGKMLVTTLNNYSMPLIRYDIGDVAIPSEESDAYAIIGGVKSYFKIDQVIGRTLGFFKKENGDLVHSHHMVQQMFFRKWIKQFQFVQDEYHTIRCRIITRENQKPPANELEDIRKSIQILTGTDMNIAFEFPKEIERSNSGKFIYTMCNVS